MPRNTASAKTEERRARRNAQAQTGCSISLEATPPTITAGALLSLAGTLSCPEAASAAGQADLGIGKAGAGENIARTGLQIFAGDFAGFGRGTRQQNGSASDE